MKLINKYSLSGNPARYLIEGLHSKINEGLWGDASKHEKFYIFDDIENHYLPLNIGSGEYSEFKDDLNHFGAYLENIGLICTINFDYETLYGDRDTYYINYEIALHGFEERFYNFEFVSEYSSSENIRLFILSLDDLISKKGTTAISESNYIHSCNKILGDIVYKQNYSHIKEVLPIVIKALKKGKVFEIYENFKKVYSKKVNLDSDEIINSFERIADEG